MLKPLLYRYSYHSVKQNSSKLTVFEITIPLLMSCANLASVAATVARLPVVCSWLVAAFVTVLRKSVRTSSSMMLLRVCEWTSTLVNHV